MPVSENIAAFMRRYKEDRHLSIMELSQELGISKNTVAGCLNGSGNLRSDTIGVIVKKCGVPATEIISAQPPGWERAEIMEQAARIFSDLSPEHRNQAVTLFIALVDLLAEEDRL